MQLLLKASPAEMRAICKVSPNLLVRDPGYLANNIAELAQMLQLTQASKVLLRFACLLDSVQPTHMAPGN